MILGGGVKAYVCTEPVDMRKSIDGLSQLVEPLLSGEAFSGSVFVFMSRWRENVKLLWWDRHGFWLVYKPLERGRFPRPEELVRRGLPLASVSTFTKISPSSRSVT